VRKGICCKTKECIVGIKTAATQAYLRLDRRFVGAAGFALEREGFLRTDFREAATLRVLESAFLAAFFRRGAALLFAGGDLGLVLEAAFFFGFEAGFFLGLGAGRSGVKEAADSAAGSELAEVGLGGWAAVTLGSGATGSSEKSSSSSSSSDS
jgi:hypothetical protein